MGVVVVVVVVVVVGAAVVGGAVVGAIVVVEGTFAFHIPLQVPSQLALDSQQYPLLGCSWVL